MHVSQYSSCFQCLSIQDVLIYDLKHIGSFRDNFLRSTQIETWHICLFYLFVKYPMTPWTLKNLNYLSFMPEFSIFWCFLMFPKIQIKMNHYKSWYYRKNISRFQLNSWYKVAHLVYSPLTPFFFSFWWAEYEHSLPLPQIIQSTFLHLGKSQESARMDKPYSKKTSCLILVSPLPSKHPHIFTIFQFMQQRWTRSTFVWLTYYENGCLYL